MLDTSLSVNFDTLTRIQRLIADYRTKWIAAGQWQDPDAADALLFCLTELGEATAYTGNVQGELATELFDMVMMALIALEKMGESLLPVGEYKRQSESVTDIFIVYLAQAAEAYLRSKSGYVRNNERTTEAAGVALSKLCYLAVNTISVLSGGNVIGIAEAKLKKMDAKRSG